jgi:hypothetical protein
MTNISTELEALPHWPQLNAYERALACCQLLSGLGQPIPGWMQIRQWIGKGSANDIHRAKQDFLTTRQTALPAAFNTEGLPPALSGSIHDWWQQLRLAAADEYQQHTIDWQARLDHAQQQVEQHQQARRVVEEDNQRLREQVAQLQDRISRQMEDLRVAQDAALRAEALQHGAQIRMEEMDQGYATQFKHMTDTLTAERTASQQQWHTQLAAECARIEGLQQFATEQIEHTRQDHVQRQQQWTDQQAAYQALLAAQAQQQHTFERQLLARLTPPPVKPTPVRRRRSGCTSTAKAAAWYDTGSQDSC